MTHPNDELIQRFYGAFARGDGDTMASCYRPDGHFRDPAFGDLTGVEAGAMWRMLTGRAKDLRVELGDHRADDVAGTANWVAHYTFAQTGRKVVNEVHATFRFEDGLIADHVDQFDFWRWSRQALGVPGLVLGWTPLLQRKVNKQARTGLNEFMAAG